MKCAAVGFGIWLVRLDFFPQSVFPQTVTFCIMHNIPYTFSDLKWPSVSMKPVYDNNGTKTVILRITERFKVMMNQALINESHHISEGDKAGHKTRSPSAARELPDWWLIDWRADHFHKQQCSNSTQRVCFLATGELWYYSRIVRDGLLRSQQFQRNNTCSHQNHKHWWCEPESMSILSVTWNPHVPLDLVGVKLSKALHMDTALALGLKRRIAEPSSAVNNRHHLFLSIRGRGKNECCC